MVSIHDVAARSGVAKSTVSKVLNKYPNVSEKTRAKVENAVRELGYVPNTVAISLSKKNFNRIGLIIEGQSHSPYTDETCMRYLSGIFQEAITHHIDITTYFTVQFSAMEPADVVSLLKGNRINCVILFGMMPENQRLFNELKSHDFYIVLVDSNIKGKLISSVAINFMQAQYEAAKKTYLQSDKQDTVLYLGGPENSFSMKQKLAGMLKLQKEYGFKLITKNVNYSERQARNAVLKYGNKSDIIICASDKLAISSVLSLIELDIFRHVCGFDGLKLIGYTRVEVNTVIQDFSAISRCAFLEMMRLLEGKSGRHVVMPFKINSYYYLDVIE